MPQYTKMLQVGKYVLYSPDYGGSSLPTDFLEALFVANPPESASGAALWEECGPRDEERLDRTKGIPFEGAPGYKRSEAAGEGGYVWKDEPQSKLYFIYDFHELKFRIHPDVIAHYMCAKRRSREGFEFKFVPAGCNIDRDTFDGAECVRATVDVDSLMNDMQDNGNRNPLSKLARSGGAAAVEAHLAAVTAEKMAAVEAHVCPAGCEGCIDDESDDDSYDSGNDDSEDGSDE